MQINEFLGMFTDTVFVSIPKDGGYVLHTKELQKVLDLNETSSAGAYFTVNGFKNFVEGDYHGRTKVACTSLNGNFLDIDLTPETKLTEAELIYKELTEAGLQPTAVVLTGKGLHVYWLYDKPREVTVQVAQEYEALQTAIVEKYKRRGADAQARDIARVLRVPGARYYDKELKRQEDIKLLYLNLDKKYEPVEIAKHFMESVRFDVTGGKELADSVGGFDLKSVMNVKSGTRHHDAYSAALSIIQMAKTLAHARKMFEAVVSTWEEPDWLDMWKQFENARAKIEKEQPQAFIGDKDGLLVSVTSFEDVEEKPVEWLWDGFIAKGKPHMLTGEPGLAKSQLTLDIAARLSRGGPFPSRMLGQTIGEPVGTIILSAEDDPGDTIKPRLRAAGADLKYIASLSSVILEKDRDGKPTKMRSLALRDDAEQILRALVTLPYKVGLVVIDPISAFLNSQQDSNSNSDARGTLAQLQSTIMSKGIAMLIINHNNKNTGAKSAHQRSMGSVGWNAAARATFYVFKDTEDEERNVFSVGKMNLAKSEGKGFFYKIREKELEIRGSKQVVPYIEWDEKTFPSKTADEYTEESGKKKGFKYEQCEVDLKMFMFGRGKVRAKDALSYMKERSYSPVDVYKAAGKLGVLTETHGEWEMT
jgi:hypothetical protein